MSRTVKAKDHEQYLAEGRSWETNRVLTAEKSQRYAWRVAGGFGTIALVAVIAVAGMTPLKRTELKVVRIFEKDGTAEVISEMTDLKTNYTETVNRFFVQQYIRVREGYSRALAEEYYKAVGLMSTGAEQRRYLDYFNPKNPQSPLNVFGTSARVKVVINSTSFIKDNIALVRYSKVIERGASERPLVTNWAATVVFQYSTSPMKEADREINPLGFQVTEYRNDPDTAVVPEQMAQPVAPVQPAPTNTPTILPGLPPAPQQPQVPAPQAAAIQ